MPLSVLYMAVKLLLCAIKTQVIYNGCIRGGVFLKKLSKFLLIIFFICSSTLSIEAYTTPEPSTKTIKREIKMGKKAVIEIEKTLPRVLDPNKEAHLAMITGKLTPFLQRDLDYNVRILEMKEPNAFSLPGGTTYITTGMLSFLKSDAEIAAILAHEFVHADRAHVIIQNAKNAKLNIITLIGIIAATQGAGVPAMLMSNGLQTAIMNSYSIDMEKEADARGIDILHKAGYNPSAMLTTMERLKIERLKKAYVDPGIYQTHPDDKERVDAALKYMKDKGIEVQRKEAVQSLKIVTTNVSGDILLTVDGHTLVSLKESKEAENIFNELTIKLNNNLELELAPYDIQVTERDGEESLFIRGNNIIKKSECLPEMPTLNELRKRINDVLNNARRENPLSNYYQ